MYPQVLAQDRTDCEYKTNLFGDGSVCLPLGGDYLAEGE